MGSSQKAILQTLLYSDIFSFPLTKDEITTFLISDTLISSNLLSESLRKMSSHFTYSKNYYAFKGREKIIKKRILLINESEKKIKFAKKIVRLLSFIPTINLIGVSGGLAVGDVDKGDDIDLFIITSKDSLWLTRLCILSILELKGIRRKRLGKKVSNTFCVNMMIEENALELDIDRRDLYTAKEVVQMLPMFERGSTYKLFLRQNKWVTNFLPNAILVKKQIVVPIRKKRNKILRKSILSQFNKIARKIQIGRIMRNKTTEIISDKLVAFHPKDYRKQILNEFEERLKEFSL